jgi:hypothetical protein
MAQVQDPDDTLQGNIDRPVCDARFNLTLCRLRWLLPISHEWGQCPIINVRYRQITYIRVKLFNVGGRKADRCLVFELNQEPRGSFPPGSHLANAVNLFLA